MLHDTNRGVSLYGDKVFYAAAEAVLVALDARTGKEVWTKTVADNKSAYYITLAPLVAGGKVMVGASGGEFGVRGFVAAFDPDSGKELWRTFTVPGAGRAWQRDVAEGRSMEDRRRAGVGDRQLRSRHQHRVLGNRQRRTVDGRSASRRQPLRRVDDRDRRRDRTDQGALPVQPERVVGLGRGVAADPRGLPAQRPDDQGPGQRRSRWIPLVPRAKHRTDPLRRRQTVRDAERVSQSRSRDRTARRRSRSQARARANGPTSVRVRTVARTGRQSRSARRRG